MNKLTIIGNRTREPELRTTATGLSVCSFTVAVNRKKTNPDQQPEADFFRVTAWRERAEICAKWLDKGSKVCVIGPVSVRTYETQNGKHGANLEVTAEEVEFLSGKDQKQKPEEKVDQQTGYQQVDMGQDELPF